MRYKILSLVTIFCVIQFFSQCQGGVGKSEEVHIRLLPCDFITIVDNKKPLFLRLYAVTTIKDTADPQLVGIIDSFMCSKKDSINLTLFSSVVIRFVKETKLTKELENNNITDAHNPISTDHFSLLQYEWDADLHFSKLVNNSKYIRNSSSPCNMLPSSGM